MLTGTDPLVELAVMSALIEGGQLPKVRELRVAPSTVAGVEMGSPAKAPQWSEEEEQFIRENYVYMTDEELGQALGRTAVAVHIHWERDMDLPARSKRPGVLTAQAAARALGLDQHKVSHWIDVGLIPGHRMPGELGTVQMVEEKALTAWAVNPKHWMYFDWHNITDPHLRRLCELRAERWGDEWWSTKQVAAYHGVTTKDVLRYITKLGRIEAVRLDVSLGGRNRERYWSNWFVRKSEATKPGLVFVTRRDIKGANDPWQQRFTPAGDAWILKARDELGMSYTAIGRTMKVGRWSYGRRSNPVIRHRYQVLKEREDWQA